MRKIIMLILVSLLILPVMATPAAANVQGVDVSRWQGPIDWEQTKNHAGFAIIKAGGGDMGLYTDSQFLQNQAETRRLDMARGYYYYAGGMDPVLEADYFATIVGPLQPGEVVALDFEIDTADPVAYCWLFLTRAEQLLGVKPLLYTNMNRVWSYNWLPVVQNGNELWGAIYDGDALTLPPSGSWSTVTIKQYTSQGTIPGVSVNPVDVNVLNGDFMNFRNLGMPQAPVVPLPKKSETPSEPPRTPVVEVPQETTEKSASGQSVDSQVGETQTELDSQPQDAESEDAAPLTGDQAEATAETAGSQGQTTAETARKGAAAKASADPNLVTKIVMGPVISQLNEIVTDRHDDAPGVLSPMYPVHKVHDAVRSLVD